MLCLLNKAATHLKMKEYEFAVAACNTVLESNPDNVKALFRRGTALLELNKLEEAKADLEKAVSVSPTDTTVAKTLEDVNHRIAQQAEKAQAEVGGSPGKQESE